MTTAEQPPHTAGSTIPMFDARLSVAFTFPVVEIRLDVITVRW